MREILNATRRHWRVVVVATGLGLAIAAVASLLLDRIYRAEVVMVSASQQEVQGQLGGIAAQLGGLAFLAGLELGPSINLNEGLALLRSRSLTEQFITRFNLMPVLFQDRWDAERQEWHVHATRSVPTLWRAYERLDSKIRKIAVNKSTGLITFSIDWHDPKVAAKWANDFVAFANEISRQRALTESERNLAFLRSELAKTDTVEVRQAIFRLMEAQVKRAMIANVRHEYTFRVLDPAVPPDLDKYIGPRVILLLITGALLGLAAGLAWSHAFGERSGQPRNLDV